MPKQAEHSIDEQLCSAQDKIATKLAETCRKRLESRYVFFLLNCDPIPVPICRYVTATIQVYDSTFNFCDPRIDQLHTIQHIPNQHSRSPHIKSHGSQRICNSESDSSRCITERATHLSYFQFLTMSSASLVGTKALERTVDHAIQSLFLLAGTNPIRFTQKAHSWSLFHIEGLVYVN